MDQAERLARRAERKRATHRRRRRTALGIVAAIAVVAVAFSLREGDGARQRASSRADGSASGAGRDIAGGAPVPSTAPDAHFAPRESVPILMYHVIGTPRPDTPMPELWVTPADFRAQVRALSERGFHGVTLQHVWDAWHRGGRLPSKPVVFSFDDGSSGHYTHALPVLRAAGWPGVLNLKLGNLDDIRPDRVKEMIAAGWEVDSHTINHPDLTTLGSAALRSELEQSRARLRREFGVPANFFCYPAGRYNATVVAAVRRAGYLAATTTDSGYARRRDTYKLARVRVNGSDGPTGLLRQLDTLGAKPDAPPTPRAGIGG